MILVPTPHIAPVPALDLLGRDHLPPGAFGETARAFVTAVREEIRAGHAAGMGGLTAVATFTDAIDRLVRFLFAQARRHASGRNPRLHERYTLVAQGGYGRGELNLHSDIDLLFLYPWKITPHIETVIELLLYALWDAGLAVGHAVRNERECLHTAAHDVKVKTALLDARHVCGDEPLFSRFDATMVGALWTADQTRFIREKLAERTSRHARAGRSVRLLQPELKEGQGGLRDLHTAMWMAKTRYRVRTLRQLVAFGVITEEDMQGLGLALDFLWRLRNMMHLTTGKHEDRLGFELQETLAPSLGFGDGRPGVERLMRSYYRHATLVHALSQRIIDQCSRATEVARPSAAPVRVIGEGLRIRGAQLSVTGPEVFADAPWRMAEVFAAAQRHGVTLAPATERLVSEAARSPAAENGDGQLAGALRAILRAERGVADTLDEMHRLGVLGVLLPEFGRLDCMLSHDPFHMYTVDQHTLLAVREIDDLVHGIHGREEPLLTRVARDLPQLELLYLGMLCHDVGKGEGGDHSERGVGKMFAIAERLGLNEDEAAAAAFLVRHHLLMSHLAQRRDIRDPQLVADFCRTVGTVDNLQRLTVITYADMRAVADGVWNAWRGGLVRELYERAYEVLTRGELSAVDQEARAARIRARVVDRAQAAEAAGVAVFLASMPEGYVLSTPEDLLLVHATLAARYRARRVAGDRPAYATVHQVTAGRGVAEFAVCTADEPGVLGKCAGALAAHGMNVLSARIATSSDGVVVDAFRIAWEDAANDDRWERLDATLGSILAGEVVAEDLVRRVREPLRSPTRPVPTEVSIDNGASATRTVIEVETGDRPGLLFTITSTLHALEVDIHLAKINTLMDRVLDVLYVTERTGDKITDGDRLRVIESSLRTALVRPGHGDGRRAAVPA